MPTAANARKAPSFVVGTTVRITATHKVDGTLTTPTTCTITIEEPDGTDNTPSVSQPSTGLERATFTPDQSGWHRVRIVSSGNSADGAREYRFYVASSGVS